MPIYAYVCPECGAEQDQFNRISERRTNAPHCHGAMDIKLSAVLGHVQRDCCYRCPVTDQPITTNRQRANVMAEHGLVDANDFKPEQAVEKQRKRYERNAELAAQLSTPVDKLLDQYRPALPTMI
jgi:putative FmdB family regulatory protein